MRKMKQWVLILMASFMLISVAAGCSNEGTETEENQTEEEAE
ncbi:hypothetical protein [Bacillus sp. V3B]|nr:hypothetical protein [Bacillus sp. V3B]